MPKSSTKSSSSRQIESVRAALDIVGDIVGNIAGDTVGDTGDTEVGTVGASLEPGLSSAWPIRFDAFPGRLVFAPKGIPSLRTIAIVGSRLGQNPERHPHVFEALRTRVARLSEDEVAVSGCGMSLDRYVSRAVEWYGKPLLTIERMPPLVDDLWVGGVSSNIPDNTYPIFVSKELADDGNSQAEAFDSAIINVADEVFVLHMSANGNVDRAVSQRLASKNRATFILDTCQSKQVKQHLNDGAALWHLYGEAEKNHVEHQLQRVPQVQVTPKSELGELPDFRQYLLHWTRAQANHWIDESEAQAIDRVLFSDLQGAGIPQSHSALGTLLKIVAQKMLLGSSKAIRGQHQCVCWSNIGLAELASKRKFRKHRSRWDFEPFGIAIRRDELAKQGARSVIYGDEETWEGLDIDARPFFQKQSSDDGRIDWSDEQEWRSLGNLDLANFGTDEAFVFVEKQSDVSIISQFTHWPVVAIEQVLADQTHR